MIGFIVETTEDDKIKVIVNYKDYKVNVYFDNMFQFTEVMADAFGHDVSPEDECGNCA